ncbi:zinc-finger of the MIZ type in Nse subunit-domain-containing protein [Thelephora terrestris]|uniref:Zinc-finger of the MIZ type in Nse subunit-domain-containing protein n=1 Tax=Thelephora terrestris TaxID=56493 RepID=A0A9P6H8I1_9AGAM|nr:zinc-finger of the MIZ type in Nse subunit-domain-containing protein [Thelephora terrestris]
MPVASSSRRTRRQPSEDISEDPVSQRTKAEDVDMDSGDDTARQRGSRKEKRGKVKKKPADNEAMIDVELDAAGDAADEPFDRNAFLNRPLSQKQQAKLHSLASDAEVPVRAYKQDVMEIVKRLAGNVAEFTTNYQDKTLKDLDLMMRGLMDVEQYHYLQRDVVSSFHGRLTRGEEIEQVGTQFGEGYKEKKEEYEAKTSRQKYLKNDDYKDFKEAIFQVDHKDEAMPPMTTFIEKEPGDASDDDDIEVGGVTQDYKCPITLTPLEDPLTSKICNHSFSGAAIREYLSRGSKKCPATGCNKKLTLTDLKMDKALERRVKEHARRAAMRDDDNDVDAEIID